MASHLCVLTSAITGPLRRLKSVQRMLLENASDMEPEHTLTVSLIPKRSNSLEINMTLVKHRLSLVTNK